MVLEFDISNTEIPEDDISKSDRRSYDMLLYIVQQGRPISAWDTHKQLHKNQPTVHNIFKKFQKEESIEQFGLHPRSKIEYGPTWKGLLILCLANENMLKELDVIMECWLKQPQFYESLKKDFGNHSPDFLKELTMDILGYFIDASREGDNVIDSPEWVFYRTMIGEMQLSIKDPQKYH